MDYLFTNMKVVSKARISVRTEHSETAGRLQIVTIATGDPGSAMVLLELNTANAMLLCAKLQEAIAHKPETVEAS